MSFIIVDTFGMADGAIIVPDEDGTSNLVFDDYQSAYIYCRDKLQQGIVVEIKE